MQSRERAIIVKDLPILTLARTPSPPRAHLFTLALTLALAQVRA